MTHYAIIDNNSGYIWGDTHADSAIMACRIIDDEIDKREEYRYSETDANDAYVTYTVYKLSEAQFDLLWSEDGDQAYDGQDQDLIELLENQATVDCYIARKQY